MKKARVLLLNPPTAAESNEVILSLAYLASMLKKCGHQVKVIDAKAPYKRLDIKELKRTILDFEPHFIGVTLTITFIAQTYAFLEDLRKIGIPIIAGGSHVSPLPEEALAHGVDIVAIGEGENTIVELADYFAGNSINLKTISGLCIKNSDGTSYKTGPRPLIENLDEIPFPSFEDFPIRNYTGSEDVNSNPIFWAIFTSRGCPFNCTFCCGYNVFGRTYRLRSAQNIFAEIKSLAERFGVQKIAFQDDEILLSKSRIIQLCDLLSENNLKIKFSLRSRIDSMELELLNRMQGSGFRRISFGIESWNNETLEKIKKNYTLKNIENGLKVLEESRFPYMNFNTIVGFPWETKEHLQKNIDTLSKIPRSLNYFSIVVSPIPYPNTELYNKYHEKYGFTNWWLDPAKHWDGFLPNQTKPLFFYFTKMMMPLYAPEPYWKYSPEWKKEIEEFSWKVFSLYSRRHLKIGIFLAVYLLGRISHFIWKRSRRLEYFIFKWVPRVFINYVEDRLSFKKQE